MAGTWRQEDTGTRVAMFYEFEISAPANTGEGAPVEEPMKLTHGRITHGAVFFPDNSAGQLHVTIWFGGHQVWPTNPDGDIRGNDQEVMIEERYDVVESPYLFTAKAWNEDDTYLHAAIIRFVMIPIEVMKEEQDQLTWLTRIAGLLGWRRGRG